MRPASQGIGGGGRGFEMLRGGGLSRGWCGVVVSAEYH